MSIAIPHWQGRISPVYDVARRFLLVERDHGIQRRELLLDEQLPHLRAVSLVCLGVDLLICGAISQAHRQACQDAGIRLLPERCGAVETVILAWRRGQLDATAFHLPGCRHRRRQGGRHGGGCRQGDPAQLSAAGDAHAQNTPFRKEYPCHMETEPARTDRAPAADAPSASAPAPNRPAP